MSARAWAQLAKPFVGQIAALASLSAGFGVLAATPPALSGAQLYQARCGACHSLDANRVGPAHRGVVGRKAGTAAGYNYSPALAGSGIVWTEANLDRWLQGPQKLVPGVKMYFSLSDPADRAAIIAYLKDQK